MWILPSRSRPHNIERLVKAFKRTGATTPVWLRVDLDDPMLGGYVCPADMPWRFEAGTRQTHSGIYNEFFRRFPNLKWFGFIADDVVPETSLWDRRLIEIAGSDGMAVPAGGDTTGGAPHFVLGGDLVRSVGWLALPGLDRIFIDTAWLDIAQERGVFRFVPDVVLKHRHFSNRMALFDSTYKKRHKAQDRAIYNAWRR